MSLPQLTADWRDFSSLKQILYTLMMWAICWSLLGTSDGKEVMFVGCGNVAFGPALHYHVSLYKRKYYKWKNHMILLFFVHMTINKQYALARVYLPIGWVSHVEKEVKRSKRGESRETNCRVWKKYPSVCKMSRCYGMLFYLFIAGLGIGQKKSAR